MPARAAYMTGRSKNPAGVIMDSPKSLIPAWKRIIRYMGRYAWPFLLAVLLAVVESLLAALAPNQLSKMTDIIEAGLHTGDIDIHAVSMIALLVLALYVGSTLMSFGRYRITSTISQTISGHLRRDMASKMNRLPLGYVDSLGRGDLMSRFANDTDTIGAAMNSSLGAFVHGIAAFAMCVIMMLVTDVRLTLVVVGSSMLGVVASVVVIRSTQRYYRSQQSNIGRMYGLISEVYSSKRVVMAYCGERDAKARFDSINEDLRDSCLKSEVTVGLLPAVTGFVSHLSYLLVCIVGALMVLNGEITIGVIVAFIVYVKMFGGPFDMISGSISRLQAAAAASERIFEFLDHEEMPEDAVDPEPVTDVRGHVEFRDVRFSYAPGKEIIHGFTADIQPGQKVAIVGPTGAGKTTVVNLLMRFYDMDSGDILVDGRSIKTMSREQVHDLFCMVLQDTWLMDGTIRENVAYCTDATDDEVVEACRAVGIDQFIDALPDGYDTKVGDGLELSAGQRQQVTIARAMLDRSPMLIFDEATSSVDTRTERRIQSTMANMMEGRTSFIIAHRLSTIRDADVIIVMDRGEVVEQGTHEELLSEDGVYRRLYQSQFDR